MGRRAPARFRQTKYTNLQIWISSIQICFLFCPKVTQKPRIWVFRFEQKTFSVVFVFCLLFGLFRVWKWERGRQRFVEVFFLVSFVFRFVEGSTVAVLMREKWPGVRVCVINCRGLGSVMLGFFSIFKGWKGAGYVFLGSLYLGDRVGSVYFEGFYGG